jgi:hypothetical protein
MPTTSDTRPLLERLANIEIGLFFQDENGLTASQVGELEAERDAIAHLIAPFEPGDVVHYHEDPPGEVFRVIAVEYQSDWFDPVTLDAPPSACLPVYLITTDAPNSDECTEDDIELVNPR